MSIHVADSRPLAAPMPGASVSCRDVPLEDFEPWLRKDSDERLLDDARAEQSLIGGFMAGVVAAAAGAVLWATITAATTYQIGWMAIGVGFLVGYGVRTFGKGVDCTFGFMGAGLALAGCLAGNVLAVCALFSQATGLPLSDLVMSLTPSAACALVRATFGPIDMLFYGIALIEGYRFSFRHFSS